MAKVTIKDVAKAAGVSISLVSIVMNNRGIRPDGKKYAVNPDTAKRISETAERLGYHPNKAAASLRGGRYNTIGVITSDISNKFFADISRYIENVAHESDYTVLFGSSDESADKMGKIADTFINNGIDGLIIAPCRECGQFLKKVTESKIPTVLIDRDWDIPNVSRITLDNVKAGRMAVEHLYNAGYRKIEMISYTLGISSLAERELGYKDAMREFGLGNYAKVHYTTYGNPLNDIRNLIADMLNRGVEAIFLPSNTLSTFSLKAIIEMKVDMPDSLGVLCFDESDLYDTIPPVISRISQSTKDMAEQAFGALKELIEGTGKNRDVKLEPTLIVGGSTAKDNAKRSEPVKCGIESLTPQNSRLLCGTMFDDRGGWTLDSQYIDGIGSSYLLAHGLGTPVKDACTEFYISKEGNYRIFVRTMNWTAPFTDAGTPGTFKVCLDEDWCPTAFGNSAREGWHWQEGDAVHLTRGKHRATVHDMTGFEGRFDAILLTTKDVKPDDSVESVYRLRRDLLGISDIPASQGSFDIAVVGGGVAGMCAALSAARLGLSVALIQDRDVLGGNNSSEVRVGLGGRLNIGDYPSLGYLLNEFAPSRKGNARTADIYEDEKKMDAIRNEKRIRLFTGFRVNQVIKKDERTIDCVIATDVRSYKRISITAKLFADCTGDASLGVAAGAEWHMGREAKEIYGEPSAPEKGDGMTMGASVQWYSEESDKPEEFPQIDWGLPVDSRNVQKVHRGQWYWEVGMNDDQIAEAERIRDYGMYVAYSNWACLKNSPETREEYRNSKLSWVSYIAGKRESRRLIGDFVLREQDLADFVRYPDGSVSTSWYIDQHLPDPENSRLFPGHEYLSCGHLTPLSYYPIPYRCFYSKDIDNLFMAGRDISVSHIALGTIRVMRTTAMMGEVVGMAASICIADGVKPRDIYESRFDDLKELMKKGVGRTDVPYTQVYTLIDTTAARSEDC